MTIEDAKTFGDISNERQWEWDREIELCRDFIDEKGLNSELIEYVRREALIEDALESRKSIYPEGEITRDHLGYFHAVNNQPHYCSGYHESLAGSVVWCNDNRKG